MNPRKNLAPGLADLQKARGKSYWRTLEELAESDAFQEMIRREFPEQALEGPGKVDRRRFLALMGASLALAGVNGCSVRPAPSGTIVPQVRAPEEIIPGKPLFYATAMTLAGTGVGLLVESHEGRPTKIEGNPEHPASLGATDLFHQASILTLYDPDRSQTVTRLGQTSTWDDARNTLRGVLDKQRRNRGARLRLLTETVVSPTLAAQIDHFLEEFPEAQWHQYEPLARDSAQRAAVQGFGKAVATRSDFTKADVVLSFDDDFLSCGPGNLRYIADFMSRRRIRTDAAGAKNATMNRLYVAETTLTSTGTKADHRLAMRARDIEGLARAVAAKLGIAAGSAKSEHEKWAGAVAKDLQNHPGSCVVLAGYRQPPAVHLLAHAMNHKLGAAGKTVLHTDPVEAHPVDQARSLRTLIDDMNQGKVEVLLILGGNPVYTAPVDLGFKEAMQKVDFRAHLSLYQDETSLQCHWHFPEAHYLEAWSDTRAFDGTASIVQPLIEPLYHGRSAHELLAMLTGPFQTPAREIVRNHWRKHHQSNRSTGDFDDFWEISLHDGVIAQTELSHRSVELQKGWEKHLASPAQSSDEHYELVIQPDPTIFDGRFANNGWLQELPKPMTHLTWDNAALISPATAKKLGVSLGTYAHGGEHGGFYMPVLELTLGKRTVRAPAWIMPGHADDSVTVYLGYGRENAGKLGGSSDNRVGFNAYELVTETQPWFASGLTIKKTWNTHLVACTQQHQLMENRETIRAATLDEYKATPDFASRREREHLERAHDEIGQTPHRRTPLSLYPDKPQTGNQWGMVIDTTTCTGCSACVVACQAENNIPVVGKEQVAAGREMHWLRIDRYNAGAYESPTEFYFQPLHCMHCENAPCEYVCPVEATIHSADGLNEMLYQRCVGTRFCSNNCPYKVRRFNFFHYGDFTTTTFKLQYNPDVTVRSRGVMEKCSYCVQRIRQADISAQKESREIRDGEILTACQAACPAQAIVFGNIKDETSKVYEWKHSPLHYGLLTELNTVPRTTYLGALRNPNPELEEK